VPATRPMPGVQRTPPQVRQPVKRPPQQNQ
jgi:hypothetical protein